MSDYQSLPIHRYLVRCMVCGARCGEDTEPDDHTTLCAKCEDGGYG